MSRKYWPTPEEWPADGAVPTGPTASRPDPADYPDGFTPSYFDTDVGAPIWWDGDKWVDAAGNVPA